MPRPPLPRNQDRPLHLCIDSEALRLFLGALLEEWQFRLQPEPQGAQLLLVEEGVALPPGDWPLLTLSRSHDEGRDRLSLPMTMERLWGTLEGYFHRPQRNHLRIELELEARVEARGERLATHLYSLSDLGGRFPLSRELAGGEQIQLSFHLPQHRFEFPCRVIYSIPSSDWDAVPSYDTGVIFDPIDRSSQNLLREYMIRLFLQRLQPRLPGWAFQVGLTFFDLPAAVLQDL